MQNELHFRGAWFTPGKTETQIPGILNYTPQKGADLQLFGILNDSDKQNEFDLPVICGITEDGKKITLYKCSRNKSHFNSNGLESCSFEAIYMFVGLLIPIEELKFKSINIQFQDFESWLKIYGFKMNEFKKESKQTNVEYQQPDDLSFSLYNGVNCRFKFSTYAPNTTRLSSLTINQVCDVSLTRENETDFITLFNWFQGFQMFLTLSYFERPLIKTIKLKKVLTSEKHGTYDTDIELYFQTDVTYEMYEEKRASQKFLFIYNDIRENFQDILSRWFEAEDTLSPSIYGLSEAFSKNKTAVEFSFLNIAHAIETLHRRRRRNFVLPTNEYKAKVKEMISSVAPEHADWLKAKLEFGNEPSLHERLKELIEELPNSIKNVLLKPNPEKFILDFKRSRNYYTHYSAILERKALKGGELFYLKERCKILLICFVLKEIGFTDGELEKIVFKKGVQLFNHIIKYEEAKEHFSSWE